MLKGNLSTRPFYNDRLATLAIALVAVAAALLTAYNASALLTLSAARRDLNGKIERDRADAGRIRSQAMALEQGVDRASLGRLADAAGEANNLIDQRTFSWTAFFGLIEKTLPIDVRLVMVSPRVERGAFRVAMRVVARDLADTSAFVDALLETGKFYDVASVDMQRRDDGTLNALIEASYLSPGTVLKAAHSAPAPAPVSRPPR